MTAVLPQDAVVACDHVTRVHAAPDIYRVRVPLRDSGLVYTNCYLIKGEAETLIIDTGFDHPECREAMWAAMRALDVDVERTSLLLTHYHCDHAGSYYNLLPRTCPRYMSTIDKECLDLELSQRNRLDHLELFTEEGAPLYSYEQLVGYFIEHGGSGEYVSDIVGLNDGGVLKVDDYEFQVLLTPGHTPGHLCLYNADQQIVFLGDHILFDISPNVCFMPDHPRMLTQFLESLQRIGNLPIQECFIGHQKNCGGMTVKARADALLLHHRERLFDVMKVLESQPQGATAFEITQRIPWMSRENGFARLTNLQVYFAQMETLVHLEWLIDEGIVERSVAVDRLARYRLQERASALQICACEGALIVVGSPELQSAASFERACASIF